MKAYKFVAFTGVLVPAIAAAQGAQQQEKRLNIIHIMSDDHSYQTISAYDHPISRIARTPNIDRIADEGLRFDRAYVENSLSTPSRACLMTGLYSHQNGQRNLGPGIDSTLTFLPEILRGAGYETAMIGKWHMQCEPKGFDFFYVLNGQGAYYNTAFKSHNSHGQYIQETGYVTNQITQHTLEFLEQRDTTKPFCLFVHHKAPHRNWMPDLDHLGLYEDEVFPLPETLYDDYSTRGSAIRLQKIDIRDHMDLDRDLKVRDTAKVKNYFKMNRSQLRKWDEFYAPRNEKFRSMGLEGDELYEWKYQNYIKEYVRCIKSVDESVGEILDYLEANGLMDNTVIVYTSDQGFYMGEHGLYDKRFMYEEAFRTPLILRYPEGVRRGISTDVMVQNLDFAPTYLDIAGIEKPDYMEGCSFLPVVLKNGKEPSGWRDYLYYHYYEYTPLLRISKMDGVFDKRFKLIHFYGEDGTYDEFYDLKKDPTETHNAIDSPRYSRDIKRLKARLSRFREDLKVDEF
ncbi:MAG: sulfatase [Bacteroidales bacterium]|nr:sulfatase [Bacteroidales bacterium]